MSDTLHVATRKGFFTLQRGKTGWAITRTHFLGLQVPMCLRDRRDGAVYAAVGTGHFGTKLHRSDDGGKTFTEIAVPTYPPKPDNVPDIVDPNRQRPIPWSLELIWSLETGGPDQPGVIWCGTAPGGLFLSKNRGDSWELVRSLWDCPQRAKWSGGGYEYPGIHSICVDPRHSNHIAVAISCGGVQVTRDGGKTWASQAHGMRAEYTPPEHAYDPDIQDAHRMVQCGAQPDHFWVQHHNGIFKSTDGSKSWSEVTGVKPSVFGFAVVVHPRDGQTAWFVPAVKDEVRIPAEGKVVVTRTRDGGKTFDVLHKGLPQEHAYDLAYRHAMDIDTTGERLAIGSTTGSLWVSENGGEAWQTLSTHLPPIFCVRFE